jgi:N-acetyl sugar amidotransferase
MDSTAPDLSLDEGGVCRFCREYERDVAGRPFEPSEGTRIVERARAAGRGRRYDCVIGLSGGADSSWAVYLTRQHGLRPLVVHVDNGWNSELAVMNIENLVRKLNVDLFTIVIDWEQFRNLQLAFLRAGVVDLELPSDHAIIAGVMQVARKFGIQHVFTGDNRATEVTLPRGWNHRKTDLRNLRAIHRRFSKSSLSTFPQLSTLRMQLYIRLLGVKWIPFLSYFPYVKREAMGVLERELGWRPYPGKHGESIITRFYQGSILPTKFGIEKRRIHLSRLIVSGQLTRREALMDLQAPPYEPSIMESDREFVIKKFGLTEAEFDAIMREQPHQHSEYPSDEAQLRLIFGAQRWVRRLGRRLTQAA